MLHRNNFRITLQVPPEIYATGTPASSNEDTGISGRIIYHNFCPTIVSATETEVYLVRVGQLRLNATCHRQTGAPCPLSFLKFKTKTDIQDFKSLETVAQVSCSDHILPSGKRSTSSQTFNLSVPSCTAATVTFTQAEIHYAIVAKSTLPDGTTAWTGQPLKVSRRPSSYTRLQSSPLITFPESSISMKVKFGECSPSSSLRVQLFLGGLTHTQDTALPAIMSISWSRESERKVMVPHTVRWEVEEKTTILSGRMDPSHTATILASSASRSETVSTIAKGKFKPNLRYPWSSSNLSEDDSKFDVQLPFDVKLPAGIDVINTDRLSIVGDRISNAVPSNTFGIEKSGIHDRTGFVCYTEYKLRVHVEIGQDTYHKETGSLVHRKAAQYAYTVMCALANDEQQGEYDRKSFAPPAYDSAVEV